MKIEIIPRIDVRFAGFGVSFGMVLL